jgi:sirohydrochlorin cobaltochelatase
VEGYSIAQNIRRALHDAIPAMGEVAVSIEPAFAHGPRDGARPAPIAASFLPPRYQNQVPSAAPMGAAALKYDEQGNAAWDEIWTDFCDLALAGGPPHRGALLEPGDQAAIAANPEGFERVLSELERGIRMVTGLEVIRPAAPGWIGMVCQSEEMALWLLRAILVENISVRREGRTLFLPAGANFRLEQETKSVITVVAKTNHYWQEHLKATA